MSIHGKEFKIFAGSAGQAAAEQICGCMQIPLGKSQVGKFSDGETAVSLLETVRGADCFIVQSTCDPVNDNLMEMLIMADAMRRASAARITAVIPYFGYARQDRKARARDPISAKLVADLITASGVDRVLTMDLHAAQIQGFFNIPVDHLLGAPVLSSFIRERLGDRVKDGYVVVSPDLGSVTRARTFAAKIGCPMAIVDKRRPRPNESEVMNVIGDVKGKKVILVDDMIDTAGSICNAARAMLERGAVEVTACATHGVLSGPAVERLEQSPIQEVILLDTVPLKAEELSSKFTILPVAPHFAEAIERVYMDKPISPLFV